MGKRVDVLPYLLSQSKNDKSPHSVPDEVSLRHDLYPHLGDRFDLSVYALHPSSVPLFRYLCPRSTSWVLVHFSRSVPGNRVEDCQGGRVLGGSLRELRCGERDLRCFLGLQGCDWVSRDSREIGVTMTPDDET